MNFVGRDQIVKIIEKIHLHIFGCPMSDKMRDFLDNLSWSFFGGIIASSLFFIMAVVAARLLGPSEFGRYAIILAIAEIFVVVIVFGFDIGIIKSLSLKKEGEYRAKVISSSFSLFLVTTFVTFLIIYFGYRSIEHLVGFDNSFIGVAVFFAIVLSFKKIGDSYFRGMMLFKTQAKYKVMESTIAILLFFLLFFALKVNDHVSYTGALLISGLIVGLFYFKEYAHYLSKKNISKKQSNDILRYSIFGITAGVTGIIIQSFDKLFVYKYFGLSDVGMYSVYYMLSILLVSQIIQIVINVFFPMISGKQDKKFIYERINSLLKIGFMPGTIIFIIFMRIALFLFGEAYDINWIWIITLALFSAVHFYVSLYGWTLISISRDGYKKQNIGLVVGTVGYILTILIGVVVFGFYIEILFIALLVCRMSSGILYKFFIQRLLKI